MPQPHALHTAAPYNLNRAQLRCRCPQYAYAPSSARPGYVPAATQRSRYSMYAPLSQQSRA